MYFPALWERCTMDSSCLTYRVGKVQSIFSLPVNKKFFFFTLTSACLADEEAKVRRNRTLWERCAMCSSCSTYGVGKVQSIFSLPGSIKSYSVIPLFLCSVIPSFRYSVFRVLPTPTFKCPTHCEAISRATEPQRPGRPWPPHFLGQFFFLQPAGN